ncbi:beta-ketoacyl synthase N-terminal-like domain-containing protein [Oceanobacillus manasiensis]|uniref:beta-ketoacyl synthase N-terminal-like domain-containing protein n=1 Tax=Oceanobacillus manasiensis TaxID=586413 RepID=UPI0005A8FEE0|nr:beta-ketoacyl synthase N-terminal-like domain-containing protein [Oceanobacillus manasiensis]
MGTFNFNLDEIDLDEIVDHDGQPEVHSNQIGSDSKGDAVAIIGISGRVGAAENLDEFWGLLVQGREGVKDLPSQRYKDLEAFLQAKNLSIHDREVMRSTYMTDIAGFDPGFFGISQQEANYMDPNQRIFLETAWKALEDSGYGGTDIIGSNTGIFVGFSTDFNVDYRQIQSTLNPGAPEVATLGNIKSLIASRLAYHLNFKGPTLLIDTACSSGLMAMYHAYRSIDRGDCSVAIAGSVKSQSIPLLDDEELRTGIKGLSGIGSSDSKTRTFDDSSDGTTTAEGSFAFVLKSLEEAKRDGDHIYAVILGGASNQDGASNGITAPNSEAQKELIIEALDDAGVTGDQLSYIEAHGTGTRLGDPVEIDGIQRAISQFTEKKQFCGIGSLKSNIGHLDHASGLGGVAKLVLAMKKKVLPASLHFSVPNRNISFVESPVHVIDKTVPWSKENEEVLRAGINSFGLSGTNCHLVLESAPKERVRNNNLNNQPFLLPLSAKTLKALRLLTAEYIQRLEDKEINLADMVYTASQGRMHHPIRLAIRFDTREQLMSALRRFTALGKDALPDSSLWYGEHRLFENESKRRQASDLTPTKLRRLEKKAQDLVSANHKNYTDEVLNKLAELYILGVELPWDLMMRGWEARRIPLPTYPFQHRHCWVESKAISTAAKGHPLLGDYPVSTIGHTVFRKTFQPENYWELTEHRIMGISTLPGSALLEIMVEWARNVYGNNSMLYFTDVRFIQPFTVEDGASKELHLLIEDKGTQKHMQFASLNKENEWVQHAEATFEGEQKSQSDGVKVNMEHLMEHVDTPLNIDLSNSESQNIIVSERWTKSLIEGRMDQSGKEYLIKLSLPEKYKEDRESYHLHPAVMDLCMNGINIRLDEKEFYLPLSYGELFVYNKLSTTVYAHLTKIDETNNSNIHRFNVKIYDSTGNLLVEVKDYCIKSASSTLNRTDQSDGYGYKRVFRPYDLPKEVTLPSGAVVLAGKSNAASKAIKDVLTEKGTNVIEISPSDNNLEKSLKVLEGVDMALTIFTWSAPEHLGTDLDLWKMESEDAVMEGFQFLKAWSKMKFKTKLGVIALTRNAWDVNGDETNIQPGQAALTGLWEVGRQEFKALNMRVIDYDHETSAELLLHEIANKDRPSFLVYRSTGVYEPGLEESRLPAKQNKIIDKEEGVYVLSGGTGDLGIELAGHLAKLGVRRLVLLGQRPIPQRELWESIVDQSNETHERQRVKQWLELKNKLDSLEVLSVAIDNYEQVSKFLSDIRSAYGRIKGVFHLAGKAGDGFIYKKQTETFYDVYSPKVNGAIHLHLATLQDNPDIFITFSSIASLEPRPGQGDYTSANMFLDAFIVYRQRMGLPALSLQWPAWRETGMARRMGAVVENQNFTPLDTREALVIMEHILSQPESLPAVLMPGQIQRTDNIRKETRVEHKPKQHTGEIRNVYLTGILDPDEVDMNVANIWARTLLMDTLDADDEFDALGGNSILTIQLHDEYEISYPGMMDIADLFTYTTVLEQANYIKSQLGQSESVSTFVEEDEGDSEGNEDIDDILDRIAQGDLTVEDAMSHIPSKRR